MIPEEEFIEMRKEDEEIGYGFGITPKVWTEITDENLEQEINGDNPDTSSFMEDLKILMEKHRLSASPKASEKVLDVSQGKLTLEQINLIYKHIPVDLSFVDENELVKFYNDTKHRIFPRSPGVIGRKVENCHPRESVDIVKQIVEAFKSGEKDQAEFWLEIADQFIYILFVAVRDENKNFKGVLEVMQDVTRIRSLTGSQRLLSWEEDEKQSSSEDKDQKSEKKITNDKKKQEGTMVLGKETLIQDLVKKYPFIKEELLGLSPKFQKLKNPILFKSCPQWPHWK